MNTTIENHWRDVRAAEGRCYGACCIAKDAVDKSRAEDALRRAEDAKREALRGVAAIDEYHAKHGGDAKDDVVRDWAHQAAWRATDMVECAKSHIADAYDATESAES